MGLEALPEDHLAVVAFNESGSGEWNVTATAPLSMGVGALDTIVKGHRVPTVINFDADPYWPKRAASLNYVVLHGLLFAGAEDFRIVSDHLRAVAEHFERGSLVFFVFNADDAQSEGMMKKYGINSKEECPRLVFLDQRIKEGNRQVPYDGSIAEEHVSDFLLERGLPLRDPLPPDEIKDEL